MTLFTREVAARTPHIAEDVTELMGSTPMLHLHRVVPAGAADIYAKIEFFNPGGSVKDRAALGMILDAERRGLLQPGGTIVEATAGNTGVGLALVEETPGSFAALQFENLANPEFHHDTTARELWEQMEGRVDAFVAGVGTGGTFSGVARFLKEQNQNILTVAVETQGSILGGGPPGPHKVEGIGVSFIPRTFDRDCCDEIMAVNDEDAFGMVKRLAAEEGLVGGSSSGAAVFAAVELARELGEGKRVAVIIPDSAERYLSKKILGGG